MNGAGSSFYSVYAQPGRWFLIGNASGTTPMNIMGADAIDVYDPQSGQYHSASMLQPGQAAWVRADQNGGIAAAAGLAEPHPDLVLPQPGQSIELLAPIRRV